MLDSITPKYLNADAPCVVRAQKGEFDALRVLFERYYDEVKSYVIYKVPEPEDAKDITSEVFSIIMDKIYQLNDPNQFRNWLITIVKQHIALYYRKRETSKIQYVEDVELEPAADNQKFDEQIQSKLYNSIQLNVRSITHYLKPKEQQALYLRFDMDLTYADIGKILGKSEPAAKKMVQRAKNKFATLYLQKYKSPVYSGGEKNEET
jgi:RNA polymerase sigma-70 factor (ECF subfamily)